MSVAGWFVANFCRWLPHASPTGLFPIGTPDEGSPVIVTGNFSLTVRRVRRALRGQNVWMLVANSNGINVWCAATGGALTEHRVIDAIKVCRLGEKVGHGDIILPALSAPGIDREAIRQETGFRAHFGPVYADDIPDYVQAGRKKTDRMRYYRFDVKHRLDMFLSMNFPVYLVVAVCLAIVWPHYLAGATVLFWSVLAMLYLFVNVIPGRTGWGQATLAAILFVATWGALDWVVLGDPLRHWVWLTASIAIFLAGGFDLAGIATPRKSDPEQFLMRIRCKRLGTVFREKALGTIALDRARCQGCRMCRDICPLGVFGEPDPDHKTTFRDRDACFGCGACVKQCPESALRLNRHLSTHPRLTGSAETPRGVNQQR